MGVNARKMAKIHANIVSEGSLLACVHVLRFIVSRKIFTAGRHLRNPRTEPRVNARKDPMHREESIPAAGISPTSPEERFCSLTTSSASNLTRKNQAMNPMHREESIPASGMAVGSTPSLTLPRRGGGKDQSAAARLQRGSAESGRFSTMHPMPSGARPQRGRTRVPLGAIAPVLTTPAPPLPRFREDKFRGGDILQDRILCAKIGRRAC